MYKILVADDHPLFRDAIINIINQDFVGSNTLETQDLDATIMLATTHPDLDLILLDLNMPGMAGFNGLLALREQCPTIPIVIVSAEEDKKIILQTLAFGAVGFITKSSSKETIANALASVFEGDVYLPPDIIRNGEAKNNSSPASIGHSELNNTLKNKSLSSLTRRQLMVLRCMTKGLANKQIADNLNISETTVKSHVSEILKKLGVYNRVQAVVGCSDINFSHYLKR